MCNFLKSDKYCETDEIFVVKPRYFKMDDVSYPCVPAPISA